MGKLGQGRGGLRGGQGRGGRALAPGAGRTHLSRVGVEALDEIDMAPGGWKVGSLEHRLAPPFKLPGVECGGPYSHLRSRARRSPRECWKREASVGLPGPSPDSGSASWNRLPTSCGVRGGQASSPGPVQPAPHPDPRGARVGRPKVQGARGLKASSLGKAVRVGRAECGDRGAGRGTWSWLWASISTTAGSR